MGRFTAVLLTVLVLAAAFCLPVSAAETTYTLPDVGMTLTLPEGVQDSDADDAGGRPGLGYCEGIGC